MNQNAITSSQEVCREEDERSLLELFASNEMQASVAGALFAPPTEAQLEQTPMPADRIVQFSKAATSLAAAKVKTPEALARLIDVAFPEKRGRVLSQAFWSTMQGIDFDLPNVAPSDWHGIYSEIDAKAQSVAKQQAEAIELSVSAFGRECAALLRPQTGNQTYDSHIPADKIDGFITLATKLAGREGVQRVDSPEKVAEFIDEALPGGKARALSDALWNTIRMTNPALPAGKVDWQAIYAALDAAETQDEAKELTNTDLFAIPSHGASSEWQDLVVPEDRIPGIIQTAKLVFAAGISTPEDFAAFMDGTFPGGKARPYSEAIWDMMGIADKSLRGTHDWQAIYAKIDGAKDQVTPLLPANTASRYSNDLPPERVDTMMKAASALIDAGVKTPTEFAARLDKLAPKGELRQYSRAFWRLMTGFDSTLEENPDWQAVYAKVDSSGTFEIGEHQFCDPDYRQILLWADALDLEPLTVVERLLALPDDWEEKGRTELEGGRIMHLHWDMELLPLEQFEWVDGLLIKSICFTILEKNDEIERSLTLPLPELSSLNCQRMGLVSLDLSTVPRLTELECGINQLIELELSTVPLLTALSCEYNQLTNLDLSAVPLLTVLNCHWNRLYRLDLSAVPKLVELDCSLNELTELCLTAVPRLTKLDCNTNELTELDLSAVPLLTNLYCDSNQLAELDLSQVPVLTDLRCDSNQIVELDLSSVPRLTVLCCKVNRLTELDLSAAPLLTALSCECNQLTNLDLSAVPLLTELSCFSNQLTELDLSSVPLLKTLNCENNQLIELNLSAVPQLRKLDCDINELTELDLSPVPNLKELCCFGNHLTFLDIRPLKHLEKLTSYASHLRQFVLLDLPPYDNLDAPQSASIKTRLVQRPDQNFGVNDPSLICGDHYNHSVADEDDPDEEATESTDEDFEDDSKSTSPNGWTGAEQLPERPIQPLDRAFLNAALSSVDDLRRLLARARELLGKDSIHAQFVPEDVVRCEKELKALRAYNPEMISQAVGEYLMQAIILGLLLWLLPLAWKYGTGIGAFAGVFLAVGFAAPLGSGVLYLIIVLIEKLFTIRQRRENANQQDKCRAVISQVFDCAEAITEKEAEKEAERFRIRMELLRLRRDYWLAMDGWKFEHAVAELLRKRGCEVRVTPGSDDGGIDLVISQAGASIIAQCKNHAAPVGPAVVRELYGAMISHGASEAWLIASSGATEKAMNFTKEKPMRVITLDEIIQWEVAVQTTGR